MNINGENQGWKGWIAFLVGTNCTDEGTSAENTMGFPNNGK